MTLRKMIFWLHLACGVIAGIFVLIMSVTGVALTYQKQMTAWADRQSYTIVPPADAVPISAELLLEKFREARPRVHPMSITISSDRETAASIATGRNEATLVNPYTGEILGTGSQGVRTFFTAMTDWHRWLSLSGEQRGMGRAVTGAANTVFLFIVLSGLYLWWPRKWTRSIFRGIAWFRSGATSTMRDSNWHNVFGFWCLVPLILIVVSGMVISYPWASTLVFQLAGSKAPAQMGPGGMRGGPSRSSGMQRPELQHGGLDLLFRRAEAYDANWKTLSLTLPTIADKTASIAIDTGSGVRPQLRSTLTLDKTSGQIVNMQRFEEMDRGMRARIWMRFVHTGEYYGPLGQTIAGIASLAGVILVWTGIALTWRRYIAWMKRRAAASV